jgi:class 3 adenylate cyclase
MVGCISLRCTAAVIAAMAVMTIATVTIIVAVETSMTGMRRLGLSNAEVLVSVSHRRVANEFVDAASNMYAITRIVSNFGALLDWPSRSPMMSDWFLDLARRMYLKTNQESVFSATIFLFADNTAIGPCYYDAEAYAAWMITATPWPTPMNQSFQSPFSFNTSGNAQVLSRALRFYNLTTNEKIPDFVEPYRTFSGVNRELPTSEMFTARELFRYFTVAQSTLLGNMVIEAGNETLAVMMMLQPIYVPVASWYSTSRKPLMAMIVNIITSAAISDALKDSRITPSSVCLAVDSLGYVIGSSEDHPHFESVVGTNGTQLGCSVAFATSQLAPARSDVAVCRSHFTAYHPSFANVESDWVLKLENPRGPRVLFFDGDQLHNYYLATTRVALPFLGFPMFLVLSLPENEVVANLLETEIKVLWVSAIFLVVTMTVVFVSITVQLSPLTRIAERMTRAANLQDDVIEQPVSMVAEVSRLQVAYYAMNEELNRIRSFVPDAVRVKPRCDDAWTEDGSSARKGPLRPPVRSSMSLRVASPKGRRADPSDEVEPPAPSLTSLAMPASTPTSVFLAGGVLDRRNVTVVFVGLKRVNYSQLSPIDVVNMLGNTVQRVCAEIEKARGVVVSFHADLFFTAFNAVIRCQNHGTHAAVAAINLTQRRYDAEDVTNMLSCGLATGLCLFGQAGSSSSRSFTIIGTPVTQAAMLQQLTSRYGTGCGTLATRRTCYDANDASNFVFVDCLRLPSAEGPRPVPIGTFFTPTSRDEDDGKLTADKLTDRGIERPTVGDRERASCRASNRQSLTLLRAMAAYQAGSATPVTATDTISMSDVPDWLTDHGGRRVNQDERISAWNELVVMLASGNQRAAMDLLMRYSGANRTRRSLGGCLDPLDAMTSGPGSPSPGLLYFDDPTLSPSAFGPVTGPDALEGTANTLSTVVRAMLRAADIVEYVSPLLEQHPALPTSFSGVMMLPSPSRTHVLATTPTTATVNPSPVAELSRSRHGSGVLSFAAMPLPASFAAVAAMSDLGLFANVAYLGAFPEERKTVK